MPTLETTVNGIKLPNPFVIGSGPPGTNANVIGKAFDEGWGAVIIKTISLDADKVDQRRPALRAAAAPSEQGDHRLAEHRADLRPAVQRLDRRVQAAEGQVPRRRRHRVDHGGVQQGPLGRDRRAHAGDRRRRVRAELLLPARPARAEDGRGHGAGLRDHGRGLRLGDRRGEGARLGEAHAQRHAASQDGCRGRAARPAARASARSTRSSASWASTSTRSAPSRPSKATPSPGGYSCTAVKPIALRMVKECAETIRDKFPGQQPQRASAASRAARTPPSSSSSAATPCRSAPAS